MDNVLSGCSDFAQAYIDDIIVYSSNPSDQLYHLRSVLQALSSAGLTVNVSKCSFGTQYIHYLGHLVGNGSLAVPEARVTHLANYCLPKSKKDLKSFIGLSSYYRRIIPSLANYIAILSPATSSRAHDAVLWTPARLDTFNCISKSLCHHTKLTIPLPTDTFTLHTDASGIGVGAVLNVVRDHCELPVSFFSRQLRGASLFQKKKLLLSAVQYNILKISSMAVPSVFIRTTNHWCISSALRR